MLFSFLQMTETFVPSSEVWAQNWNLLWLVFPSHCLPVLCAWQEGGTIFSWVVGAVSSGSAIGAEGSSRFAQALLCAPPPTELCLVFLPIDSQGSLCK